MNAPAPPGAVAAAAAVAAEVGETSRERDEGSAADCAACALGGTRLERDEVRRMSDMETGEEERKSYAEPVVLRPEK